MNAKLRKIPGPEHPIAIEPSGQRLVVSVAGRIVADTRAALKLREANYPVAYYIPRKDADMSLLSPTGHSTYCPYKGDCSYYSIPIGGTKSANAVWSYEEPYPSVAEIKGHLAFYRDRVESIEELP